VGHTDPADGSGKLGSRLSGGPIRGLRVDRSVLDTLVAACRAIMKIQIAQCFVARIAALAGWLKHPNLDALSRRTPESAYDG